MTNVQSVEVLVLVLVKEGVLVLANLLAVAVVAADAPVDVEIVVEDLAGTQTQASKHHNQQMITVPIVFLVMVDANTVAKVHVNKLVLGHVLELVHPVTVAVLVPV